MRRRRNNGSELNRRDFIRTAGLAAGVSTLLPILPVFAHTSQKGSSSTLTGKKPELRIGLLMPASLLYPDISNNWLAGMQAYLQQAGNHLAGRRVQLRAQSFAFGPYSALKSARTLVEEDRVDLVTGIIGTAVSANLCQLFKKNRTILFASHVGANVIQNHDHSPYIVHNSLNLWEANWALGNWAPHRLGKTAVSVSSFYESGYDAVYAFQLGYEHAGGHIAHNIVTHNPAQKDMKMSVVFEKIMELQPDMVFASYSGKEAAEFLSLFNRFGLAGKVHLAGSAFLTHYAAISSATTCTAEISTCLPWTNLLENAANSKFKKAYTQHTGSQPDTFALLGYETAQLIEFALEQSEHSLTNHHVLLDILSRAKIDTPRGRLQFEKQTGLLTGPLYITPAIEQGNVKKNEMIAVLPGGPGQDPKTQTLRSGIKTGWLNPYLCA